ncbi:DUF551 domain-containing protein [Klebsiella pneumoniae]
MTKSTITREESVQAVFDLKVGYRLGFADIEILKRVARMALAAMDSEPVAYIDKQWTLVYYVPPMSMGLKIGDKLYRHAQQPVVPDVMEPTIEAIKRILPTSNPDEYAACIGADMWNACRAAMLQAKSLTTINPAPTLVSLPKNAKSLTGNSPVIPEGYVMVPKEPTEAMINAWLSEVANWRGHVAGYKAMLAAAPQPQNAPQNIPEIIPGWIPVSERMPENDVSVLTFDGMYRRVHHAMYGHWQCWEPEKITHWMPLPAAPQEPKP